MLTKRMRDALVYIDAQITETGGVPPTIDMIKVALGSRSKSGVVVLLNRLEERGYIRRLPYLVRAIEVVRRADGKPGPASRAAKVTTARCVAVPVMGKID